MNKTSENRIPYVQGLRGLAVSIVVLYHAGFFFKGGFIGVDVFFVISGFVIGKSLSRELEHMGKINWSNFYIRRGRRLLPALSFTLIFTIFLSWIFFGIGSIRAITKSLTTGSLFVSNFYFFLERSYVNLASDPLRNLWSLSVEEQFYFALPLLFVLARRNDSPFCKMQTRILYLGFAVLILSFVGNVVLVNHSLSFSIPQFLLPDRFAFFSPFTRAWEFLVGLLLAISPEKKMPVKLGGILSWLSIATVLFFAFWLDSWQPFPGWFAVPVVLSSAILLTNNGSTSWLRNIFSSRPFVFLGDISYSFYLLHWPLLVLIKQKYGAEDRNVFIAVLLSLFVSALVYKYLENPFRSLHWSKFHNFGLAMLLCVLVPVTLVRALPRFEGKLENSGTATLEGPTITETHGNSINLGSKVCLDLHKQGLPKDVSGCIEGTESSLPLVFLIGDSHAESISEGVISSAKQNGFRVMTWARSSCPFLLKSSNNRLCDSNRDFLLEAIEAEKPVGVLIANGINHYFEGARDESFVPRGSKSRIRRVAKSYGETIDYLLGKNIPIALMYEVPNMDRNERKLLDFKLRAEIIKSIESQIDTASKMRNKKVMIVDPADELCSDGVCQLKNSLGEPLYADGQHLNAIGALKVSNLFDEFFAELKR